MSEFRFELDSDGVRELLRGDAMRSIIEEEATRRAGSQDGDYKVEVKTGKKRVHAKIRPEGWKTIAKNKKHNLLLKMIK